MEVGHRSNTSWNQLRTSELYWTTVFLYSCLAIDVAQPDHSTKQFKDSDSFDKTENAETLIYILFVE